MAMAVQPAQGAMMAVQLARGPSVTSMLTAAGLSEEARKAALAHPRLTRAVVAQRAAGGVTTPLAAIEAAEVVHETLLLVRMLPLVALAGICGRTEQMERMRAAVRRALSLPSGLASLPSAGAWICVAP